MRLAERSRTAEYARSGRVAVYKHRGLFFPATWRARGLGQVSSTPFDTHAEAIAYADRIARLHEPDYRAVPNEGESRP